MTEETEEQRIAPLRDRYLRAAHAVQSGIAYLMHRRPSLVEPKQLRVGIDTAKAEQGGLATLLIEKGVFTTEEYFAAMADAMEREVERMRLEIDPEGRVDLA